MEKKYIAVLKSCILEERIQGFEGFIYYFKAELFDNQNNSIGITKIVIPGRPNIVFDNRVVVGTVCQLELTKDFVLRNISFS